MELTKEEAVKLHRELWGWLAENPMKSKLDWPKWKDVGEVKGNCFLCYYAGLSGVYPNCSKCPVVFKLNKHMMGTPPYCLGGLFTSWGEATLPEERSRLAALIRDLPVKQEEKDETPALKVGDWVKVLNSGCSFSSYADFFEENNLKQFSSGYAHEATKNGECYKIVGIGKHSSISYYGPLYVLQSQNGQIFLMNNRRDFTPNKESLELTSPPAPGFNVGDKVRVKKDLVIARKYDGCNFAHGMDKYLGQNAIITSNIAKDRFYLDISGSRYSWSPSMLEPVKTAPPAPKFAVGDKVVPVSENTIGFECGQTWENGNCKYPFLYINGIEEEETEINGETVYKCKTKEMYGNDFYCESDLIPYIEPPKEVKPEPVKSVFKVGDRVRVKKDLIPGRKYGNLHLHPNNMADERGREGIVEYVRSRTLGIVGSIFSWDFEMVELIDTNPINQAPENKTLTESKTFVIKGNKTTCIIEIDGRKFKGCAKCDPGDEWNEETGKHWAELRAQRKLLDACEKDLRKRGQHA